MPYSTPIYFPSMQAYFDQITDAKKTIVIPEPIQDNDEECKDMTVKKTNSFNSNESENIILEPVLNPILRKVSITNQESETILTKKSTQTPEFAAGLKLNHSDDKATSGMVSQAFRQVDKYTESTLVRINPQFQPTMTSTAAHSDQVTPLTTPPISAVGGGV